jgi:hypothetical protein
MAEVLCPVSNVLRSPCASNPRPPVRENSYQSSLSPLPLSLSLSLSLSVNTRGDKVRGKEKKDLEHHFTLSVLRHQLLLCVSQFLEFCVFFLFFFFCVQFLLCVLQFLEFRVPFLFKARAAWAGRRCWWWEWEGILGVVCAPILPQTVPPQPTHPHTHTCIHTRTHAHTHTCTHTHTHTEQGRGGWIGSGKNTSLHGF